MITFLIVAVTFLSTFFSVYHLLSSGRYRKEPSRNVRYYSGFSIIIPCFNEASILQNTINGLLKLNYKNFEAIFINDGSKDNTLEVLKAQLGAEEYYGEDRLYAPGLRCFYKSGKYPNMYVIDKENSGKADSLNKGIAFSHNELIITLDGDCVLDGEALIVMNQVFQDEEVIASGGVVHVMQYFLLEQKITPIIALQTLDFIKGFYIYKSSLAYNNALNIISGAFGVFRKECLKAINGFRNGIGEDIDITIRLQEYAVKNNKKVTYHSGAICYTECPETWKDLARQRVRWQKAFWDALIQNRRFLFGNFLKCNVCFFMLLDAAFSGSMAVISFIFNFILIMLRTVYGFSIVFIIMAALALFFNIMCSFIAIYRAKPFKPSQSGGKKSNKRDRRSLFAGILTDVFCFSVLRIYYFIKGTISYSLNHRMWDKVKRTSNSYII